MKNYFLFSICLSMALLIQSCVDIIETDISQEEVLINLPVDSGIIVDGMVNFWWVPIDGANLYEITFVEGSFQNPIRHAGKAIIDGTLNSFDSTFTIGDYQWKIIGKNSAYSSQPVIANFSVLNGSGNDFSSTTILLNAPVANACVNLEELTFSWANVEGADYYNFQLAHTDFSTTNNIVANELIENTSILVSNILEGDYIWRVRAENANSNSPFSSNNFSVDLTLPETPNLNLPVDEAQVNNPVDLSWSQNSENVTYTLEISLDASFTITEIKIDAPANNYSFSEGESGSEYFWRVLSTDKSGNKSLYSEIRSFTIQ